MTVVDLAKAREIKAEQASEPYVSGVFFCMACDHEWQGVCPIGTHELQCPNCKSMKGRHKFDVSPQEGTQVFTCNCGNQLFNLLRDRVHCPNCGQQTGYGDLG